jgi:DNA polymerase-1
MIRIEKVLREEQLTAKMLLQVHDELVFESPTNELSRLEALVRHEMENAATLSVPLVVDVGTGSNWVETKES